MKRSARFNGSDQLMRSFDFELRRHGFAGNQCQILLELAGAISAEQLRGRLRTLQADFPIMTARIGALFRPKWKLPSLPCREITVRSLRDAPGLRQRLINEPLQIRRGELMRFDLIEREGGAMDVAFTWTHLLTDATSAEQFLTTVSDPAVVLSSNHPATSGAPAKWPERLELMKKSVAQLDYFCEHQPRALRTRHPEAPRELRYRVERLSAVETAQARANGAKLCGALGDAHFHVVAAALELHRLHRRLGWATESCLVPIPVGLRPKGRVEPLFSNQVDMLMMQFLPEHLEAAPAAAAALRAATAQALRDKSLSYGRQLAELFSFLPLPIFMRVLKHGLKGEICSLFFGDTAAVNPRLEQFLGVRVDQFTHLAAVTPSPGLGVIYYYFRGELCVTIVHALPVLSEAEASEFATALRQRLLNP